MKTPIFCPFEAGVNPFVAEADIHTQEWLRGFGLLRTPAEIAHSEAGAFTMMVGRMFHTAEYEKLCIAADLNALLFLIDDHFDSGGTGKIKAFQSVVRSLILILDDVPTDPENPVLRAFQDIWIRLKKCGAPKEWQIRFRMSLIKALEANEWRMRIMDSGQLPTLREYMYYRPMIGGANFFCHLAELMEDCIVSGDFFENFEVQALLGYCADVICFANDIFSYRKELDEGDEMNLVMLIQKTYHVSVEKAQELAIEQHNQEIEEFISQIKFLPKQAKHAGGVAGERFIIALQRMIRGNVEWSVNDTKRYGELSEFLL
ncbi:terpene synthase family protein [Chitinophaga rhizosphaerae]|uniref:terpene synthase family protein n=1 Tax=Chitinophaga rhizosphaerae TaxID=1864947 RepID=UPI000F8000F5|nr:terpene synthase family protein [Chitinophaga rhizosphaerae]